MAQSHPRVLANPFNLNMASPPMNKKVFLVVVVAVIICTFSGASLLLSATYDYKFEESSSEGLLSYTFHGCVEKNELAKGVRGEIKALNGEATVENKSIRITGTYNHLCALDITPKEEINNSEVKLTFFESGNGAKCMCKTDADVKIGPLAIGNYTLKVYRVRGRSDILSVMSELLAEQNLTIS